MSARMEIPIQSIANGTALLVINPLSMLVPASMSPTPWQALPFCTISNGNTQFPYASTPTYYYSPFTNNTSSMATFAIDHISVDYIHTQSALNTTGKLTSSIFY